MRESLALSARSASSHHATQMSGDANTRMIAKTTPTLGYIASSLGFSLLAMGEEIQGTRTYAWTDERPLPSVHTRPDLSQTFVLFSGETRVKSDLGRTLQRRNVLVRCESVVD